VITFSLNTANGVSSCGGRLVRPIIGRFCGYLTIGRSPFSNGRVTVSANASSGPRPAAKTPDAAMNLRLGITIVPP
jgi:hypothetical protein